VGTSVKNTELFNVSLGDVAATSLITLYCHALESQSRNPIIRDPKAVELMQLFNPELAKSANKLHRKMAAGKLDQKMIVHISVRARRYDQYVTDFLKQAPHGTIVNIGCGFDTRFYRIDNGQMDFYDLDFPEVIEIKRQFLTENTRYHFIPSSVLDYEWMERLFQSGNRPIMFVAEGVFMYLHTAEVKALVLKLQAEFPGAELVCEVFNALWLMKPWKRMINFKMQHELHMGKEATFNFGIRDSREMAEWNSGIEFLDEWTYLDEPEPKIGWLRLLSHVELFRKTQWTVHYRLN
jgi:methyltransferase (TIGR00027 family)